MLIIKEDKFLSKILSARCGELNLKKNINPNTLALNEFDFVYAKSKMDIKYSFLAKKLNFYLIDTSILFLLTKNKLNSIEKACNNVLIASDSHREQVQKLAYENFVYDRFHKDPFIKFKIASEIKKQWVANYFKNKRGDKCFVYIKKGKVKGFLLTIINKKSVFIDLIAVSSNARGQGIARELILAMINYYKNKYDFFKVATQFNNYESIRLYQSLGYKIHNYSLIWHYNKKFLLEHI